ncbi:hypothetical protein [Lysobacter sp. K5869]|nr:hypothetical protein [Lysobacter sp. K5869]
MKAFALCLLALSLSACDPAFDRPPLLHADSAPAAAAPAPAR